MGFGRYARAALIFFGAALVDAGLKTFGDELLAYADCSLAPQSTQICTYGQYLVDYFLLAVILSLFIYLLFGAWIENQATGV